MGSSSRISLDSVTPLVPTTLTVVHPHRLKPQQDKNHCVESLKVSPAEDRRTCNSQGTPQQEQIHCEAHADMVSESNLDPEIEPFILRDADLVEDGQLRHNLDSDWKMVQAVHVHGGVRVLAHHDGDAL